MSNKNKIQNGQQVVKVEPTHIDISGRSPLEAMQMALSGGVDLDKVEKMIELQEKWDALQAKKAYTQAMAEFKINPPTITKDKKNTQYNSMYTTLGNLINSSLPKMSECGLSHKWTIKQESLVSVSCVVTHRDGYSEEATMEAPVDVSGKKNPIQQRKSTITYLKSVTFESIMGLASTDSNLDDDGNGSEPITYIDDDQKGHIVDMIADSEIDSVRFLKYLKVDSLDLIPAEWYNKVLVLIKAKKETQNDNPTV